MFMGLQWLLLEANCTDCVLETYDKKDDDRGKRENSEVEI